MKAFENQTVEIRRRPSRRSTFVRQMYTGPQFFPIVSSEPQLGRQSGSVKQVNYGVYDWRAKGRGGVGELLTAAERSVMDDRVMTLPGDDGTGPTQAPRRIGKLRRSNKTKTNTRSAASISRCQQLQAGASRSFYLLHWGSGRQHLAAVRRFWFLKSNTA